MSEGLEGTIKKRVYIETTIPSFYFETREEPEMVARRAWTRDWWDGERARYEIVTGLPVLEELRQGDHPKMEEALRLMKDVPLLVTNSEVMEIVNTYIGNFVMPNNPVGDPLHLALASVHNCHFLLTWNCQHLANANKFEHIRHVNTVLGLYCPVLTTPVELLGYKGD